MYQRILIAVAVAVAVMLVAYVLLLGKPEPGLARNAPKGK
jgi:hypothetical protein